MPRTKCAKELATAAKPFRVARFQLHARVYACCDKSDVSWIERNIILPSHVALASTSSRPIR